MNAALEFLQKLKRRHTKHRNIIISSGKLSSCHISSENSNSHGLEEWWESPFEHEPRIPLAGKDMWAEKLSRG
jgi:hypothetical protein